MSKFSNNEIDLWLLQVSNLVRKMWIYQLSNIPTNIDTNVKILTFNLQKLNANVIDKKLIKDFLCVNSSEIPTIDFSLKASHRI